MLRLNLDKTDGASGIRSKFENIYDRLSGDDEYQRNENQLRLIQTCVVTVSAVATGCVNAFVHRDRIGWTGAGVLAILIIGFVEVFYFTLRHGLSTTYKSGMQRLAATLCYRTIQLTMILNAAVLCVWVAGIAMPPLLSNWVKWSIAIHFSLALVGVAAVRDSNPVVAHKILKLKSETARQDLITLQKAAMLGNPLVLFAAKLRGLIDGVRLAREILDGTVDFPGGDTGKTEPDGAGKSDVYPAETRELIREQAGEQNLGGGARQVSISNIKGKNCIASGGSAAEDGILGERLIASEQPMRPSQWLKSILPEASSGWWDIRDNGNRMTVKFRWRDPDLQVITPLSITSEQFETLRQNSYEEAKSRINEQISLGLYNLSVDPARCDKALLVARKLCIDLKDYQSQDTANSTDTDK
jgi:hypothetical protein